MSSLRPSSNEKLNLFLKDLKPIELKDFKKLDSNSYTTIETTPLIYLDSLEIIICRECGIFITPTLEGTIKHLKVSFTILINLLAIYTNYFLEKSLRDL